MTKGELLSMITESAKRYVKAGAMKAIKRDKHMHNYTTERGGYDNNRALIEATLVSFINFIGIEQGLDFGLYAKDLKEGEQCVKCHSYFLDGKPTCDCKQLSG